MTAFMVDTARRARAAGLAPWPPAEDGSKRPASERIPADCDHPDCVEMRADAAKNKKPPSGWTHRKHAAVTEDELTGIYSTDRSGVGVVCGAVSGGLELFEFEGRALEDGVWDAFVAAAEAAGLTELLQRIAAGYSESTPSGGIHLLYRCPEPKTIKLARRADHLPLIETKGEGGYVIVAPTNGKVHPDGGAWELVDGGFDTIVTITSEERADLHALARAFDETTAPPERERRPPPARSDGLRPGDDYNLRVGWDEVLEGWTFVFRRGSTSYWRRPGKAKGWSATTNHTGRDTLIVFSSSTPFEAWDGNGPAPSYSKFEAYAVLNHGGDFEAAARALGARGYGEDRYFRQQEHDARAPAGHQQQEQDQDDWPVLGEAAFHGLAGKVVRALEPHTEADPAGLLLAFLAFFGSAVGAAPHALADGSLHALRLFVALVGDTSRSRKGTTSARVRSVFEHADPGWTSDRIMSGFGSGEAIVDEVRDPKMGVDKDGDPVVVDSGVEDKRLLVLEGEFARILAVAAREGSTISAIMRDAWDYGRLAARARSQKSVATGAHVSFLVNITVEELRRRLTETEMANGLANRFLFGCVRRSKLLPGGGQVDLDVLLLLGTEVRMALDAARKIGRIDRSEAAEKRWAEMYAEMAVGPRGLLGAIVARAEAQTLRLSVGYALLDGSNTVEPIHLEAAYALWKFCEDSAAHIFGNALGDDVADRLLGAIRAAGAAGLDFTGQAAVFGRNVKAKRLAAARAELEELGRIRTVAEETGGRPRMVSFAVTKETKKTKEGDQS